MDALDRQEGHPADGVTCHDWFFCTRKLTRKSSRKWRSAEPGRLGAEAVPGSARSDELSRSAGNVFPEDSVRIFLFCRLGPHRSELGAWLSPFYAPLPAPSRIGDSRAPSCVTGLFRYAGGASFRTLRGRKRPGGAGSDDCRPIVVSGGQIGWPAKSSGNIILRSQSTSGLTIR